MRLTLLVQGASRGPWLEHQHPDGAAIDVVSHGHVLTPRPGVLVVVDVTDGARLRVSRTTKVMPPEEGMGSVVVTYDLGEVAKW